MFRKLQGFVELILKRVDKNLSKSLSSIWESTEGDDLTKACAILRKCPSPAFMTVSPHALFNFLRVHDGRYRTLNELIDDKKINSIDELIIKINKNFSISPELQIYLDFIKSRRISCSKFTEGAARGALINSKNMQNFPVELLTLIGSFSDRKTGGRLAQTCKNARDTAHQEEVLEKKLSLF